MCVPHRAHRAPCCACNAANLRLAHRASGCAPRRARCAPDPPPAAARALPPWPRRCPPSGAAAPSPRMADGCRQAGQACRRTAVAAASPAPGTAALPTCCSRSPSPRHTICRNQCEAARVARPGRPRRAAWIAGRWLSKHPMCVCVRAACACAVRGAASSRPTCQFGLMWVAVSGIPRAGVLHHVLVDRRRRCSTRLARRAQTQARRRSGMAAGRGGGDAQWGARDETWVRAGGAVIPTWCAAKHPNGDQRYAAPACEERPWRRPSGQRPARAWSASRRALPSCAP